MDMSCTQDFVEMLLEAQEDGTVIVIKLPSSQEEIDEEETPTEEDSINDPDNVHNVDPFEEVWHRAMMVGNGGSSGTGPSVPDFISSYNLD